MAKKTVYIRVEKDKTNYELDEYKSIKSVNIYNPLTNVWELVLPTLYRSDRPTYSVRGSELILESPPYNNVSIMAVTVYV